MPAAPRPARSASRSSTDCRSGCSCCWWRYFSSDAPGADSPAASAFGFVLLLAILGVLFSPDLGIFMAILKMLVLIACLPVLISMIFSLYTGLRRPVP